MAKDEPPPIRISRVSDVHSKAPFVLSRFVECEESVKVGGIPEPIRYVIGLVPLDCIDDITQATVYNPRHPKKDHRDELMYQVGTYGLIQPLVATLEKKPAKDQSGQLLFLIDGRHRYHGLLELDPKLRDDILEKAIKETQKQDTESLSDISELKEPTKRARDAMFLYAPVREPLGKEKPGAPMVPVKIYIDQDKVERIGMAVFLNKGQKKLAGGEEIDKIYRALEAAIEAEKAKADGTPSERQAVQRVIQGQGTKDTSLVVLSQHVARIMNDDETPWYELIGRWQGEFSNEGEGRRKPLTAKNFMAFVSQIVNDQPLEDLDEKQRDLEIDNLNRLGNIFRKTFNWPDDIPTKDRANTATALLCRSFLIQAVGMVLNLKFSKDGFKLLSFQIEAGRWRQINTYVLNLREALGEQTELKKDFEDKKQRVTEEKQLHGAGRIKLLTEIDDLRGKLWSLDTIIPSLKSRLLQIQG